MVCAKQFGNVLLLTSVKTRSETYVFLDFFSIALDYAFNFPNKGVNDYVILSEMDSSLTEFTVCLWMSSTSSQGSLFSYAVSSENNELLIYYDKYFELDIGGENRFCRYYNMPRKLLYYADNYYHVGDSQRVAMLEYVTLSFWRWHCKITSV